MCNVSHEILVFAALNGDNQEVEAALEKGAEITSKDSYGDTGLHKSAQYGHQSMVLTVLNRGLDPNIRGNNKWTALMNAALMDIYPVSRLSPGARSTH